MGRVIALASGKRGAGRTFLAVNLALALDRRGVRVTLVDLDLEAADLHLHFGVRRRSRGLLDVLSGRVASLADIAVPVTTSGAIELVVGPSETMRAASLRREEIRRLSSGLAEIPADVVLVDLGGGRGLPWADLLLASDRQLLVCDARDTHDATEQMIRLARSRRSARGSARRDGGGRRPQIYTSLEDLVRDMTAIRDEAAAAEGPGPGTFQPALVLNHCRPSSLEAQRWTRSLAEALGTDMELPVWAEIPTDPAVPASVEHFCPLLAEESDSPAARAIEDLARRVVSDAGSGEESAAESSPREPARV